MGPAATALRRCYAAGAGASSSISSDSSPHSRTTLRRPARPAPTSPRRSLLSNFKGDVKGTTSWISSGDTEQSTFNCPDGAGRLLPLNPTRGVVVAHPREETLLNQCDTLRAMTSKSEAPSAVVAWSTNLPLGPNTNVWGTDGSGLRRPNARKTFRSASAMGNRIPY